VKEAIPIKLLTKDEAVTAAHTPYFAVAIKFDSGATSILPVGIDLAAVDLRNVSDDDRPLLFQSDSMVRSFHAHDIPVASIADIFGFDEFKDVYEPCTTTPRRLRWRHL
jgi:hypothetical protein